MTTKQLRAYLWSNEVRDRVLSVMLIVQCLIIFIAAPCATADYPGSHAAMELLFLAFVVPHHPSCRAA